MEFLRANTDRTMKMTVPGPFTMAQQAQDDFYRDEEAMALDYADAVNAEIKDLFAAGADMVQIDEPWMQAQPGEGARNTASRRSTARSTASPARSRCISASAMRRCVQATSRAGYSFLAELEKLEGAISLDRGGAAEARLRGAREAAVEDHHPRRHRPRPT